MALLHLPSLSISLKPISSSLHRRRHPLPARDRVIDFGKHKGRMLGTLPSKYLSWVSTNLRTGGMDHWALLADEVLRDPVYRDRIEWEAAHRICSGDGLGHKGFHPSFDPVSELLEISERFGWDFDDKVGWSNVKLDLLGTSNGGRIPRKKIKDGSFGSDGDVGSEIPKARRVGSLSRGQRVVFEEEEKEEEYEGRGRRGERRERQRVMREQQVRVLRRDVMDGGGEGRSHAVGGESKSGSGGGRRSPFPGREALLGKIKKQLD